MPVTVKTRGTGAATLDESLIGIWLQEPFFLLTVKIMIKKKGKYLNGKEQTSKNLERLSAVVS